eukprot:549657-Ditylum_brightwellii.AAC.1
MTPRSTRQKQCSQQTSIQTNTLANCMHITLGPIMPDITPPSKTSTGKTEYYTSQGQPPDKLQELTQASITEYFK